MADLTAAEQHVATAFANLATAINKAVEIFKSSPSGEQFEKAVADLEGAATTAQGMADQLGAAENPTTTPPADGGTNS